MTQSTTMEEEIRYPTNDDSSENSSIDKGEKYTALDNIVQDNELIVLTDGDADGVAAAALVKHVYDSMDVGIIPVGPHRPFCFAGEAFKAVADNAHDGMTVFCLDTSLDDDPDFAVERLSWVKDVANLHFFDHHEWSDDDRVEFVESNTDTFEVDSRMENTGWDFAEVDERCTTQMVFDYFTRNGVRFTDEMKNRVEAVAAGDLWLKDDNHEFIHPDSQLILDSLEEVNSTPAHERYTQDKFGYSEWIDSFLDIDTELSNTTLTNLAENYRRPVENKLDYMWSNREEYITETEVVGVKVAVVYGNIGPNPVADRLRKEGFDMCASLRPDFGVSFRGSDNFTECHTIAEELGGGGHEQASGGDAEELDVYENKEELWEEAGHKLRERLVNLIEKHATE